MRKKCKCRGGAGNWPKWKRSAGENEKGEPEALLFTCLAGLGPRCRDCSPHPVAVHAGQLAVEVLKVLESRHIDDIVVLDDDDRVAGFIDVQDLPGLKLM